MPETNPYTYKHSDPGSIPVESFQSQVILSNHVGFISIPLNVVAFQLSTKQSTQAVKPIHKNHYIEVKALN